MRLPWVLPLAEEVYLLATDHGLTPLAQQIKLILDSVQSYPDTDISREFSRENENCVTLVG
jgi:hypothetical protein